MRKILIILLALVALLVVGWFGVYQLKAPDIQADIKKRVGESLTANSLDWVDYEVDGRDVTLSGVAESKQMAQHALDTANIYGLNSLTSNITVKTEAVTDAIPAVTDEAAIDSKDKVAEADSAETTDKPKVAETDTPAKQAAADVAVQDVSTEGVAALPITMNIARDESGEYIFNGTVPSMEFKQVVDEHMVSVGADPSKAIWQVELSSATAPDNWQQNVLNAVSTVQALKDGEVNLTGDQAVIRGTAVSQDASDAAEVFAQQIAGDFTTDMSFTIAEAKTKPVVNNSEDVPLVGSAQYAAKFCQTEFNALLKQQKIVFESGSSTLQASSSGLLDKISQVANRCPNQAIQVHGYTDSQGARAANLNLSKVRAETVVAYLAQSGIDGGRLVAIGHGEKNPIATNKTEAGRAQNRRIKLIVKGLKK